MKEECSSIQDNPLYGQYTCYLSTLGIHVLRNVGRQVGVSRPAAKNKEDLVNEIVRILLGDLMPIERSRRGAPVKEKAPDPAVMEELINIRERYQRRMQNTFTEQENNILAVNAGVRNGDTTTFVGTLVRTKDGWGVYEDLSCLLEKKKISVEEKSITEFSLREGDLVSFYAEKVDGKFIFRQLITVCSLYIGDYENRKNFEDFTPVYPCNKLLSDENVAYPIAMGKGQRAIVYQKTREEGYRFIKKMSKALYKENPAMNVFVVSIDGTGEDTSLLKSEINNAFVYAIDFDGSPEDKILMAEAVIERAKRFAEIGYDSVVLLDSLPALAKAYAMAEKENVAWANTLSPTVATKVKKYFGNAKKLRGGGSVSLFALSSNKTEWDSSLLAQLDGAQNCSIVLQDGGNAIDEQLSYTLKSELIK